MRLSNDTGKENSSVQMEMNTRVNGIKTKSMGVELCDLDLETFMMVTGFKI